MNEIKNTKNSNLSTVAERLGKFTKEELARKHEIIERRLFEF